MGSLQAHQDNMRKKYCILIAGPTAVGKTAVAIQVAGHFNTSVISADSRQCFKELNTGVAKPSAEELQQVKHYFVSTHSVEEEVSAAAFEQYALDAVKEIFYEKDIAVVTGGTGLYIKAFCEGMDNMPDIPQEIRNSIRGEYSLKGLAWLQEQVGKNDPQYFSSGEIQNPQRLMRALEVVQATGQSILSFQQGEKKKRDFTVIKTGIELPKDLLHRNINYRVDEMIKQGLLSEARSLLPYRNLNALQTVGYKELFDYFDGRFSLEEAVELIKKNTRQYAKRQVTWFRKDREINWFSPGRVNEIISFVQSHVQ